MFRAHAGPLYGFLSSPRTAAKKAIREQKTRTTERAANDIANLPALGAAIHHRVQSQDRAHRTQLPSYQMPNPWTDRNRPKLDCRLMHFGKSHAACRSNPPWFKPRV